MAQILIDGITNIAIHNGILRIECTAIGPDGKQHPSGTLVIPGAVAGPVLQALIRGTQELDKKLREQIRHRGTPDSMPQVAVISRERHGQKKWRRFESYTFASVHPLTPVVSMELMKAALSMPRRSRRTRGAICSLQCYRSRPGATCLLLPTGVG